MQGPYVHEIHVTVVVSLEIRVPTRTDTCESVSTPLCTPIYWDGNRVAEYCLPDLDGDALVWLLSETKTAECGRLQVDWATCSSSSAWLHFG